jgi:hypothetical protein
MLHGSRLNWDRPSEESVRKTMRKLVDEYMAAVDQDKEAGWIRTRLGCGRIKCRRSSPKLNSTNQR